MGRFCLTCVLQCTQRARRTKPATDQALGSEYSRRQHESRIRVLNHKYARCAVTWVVDLEEVAP